MTPTARSPEPIIAAPVNLVRPMDMIKGAGTLPRPANENCEGPSTSLLERRRKRWSRLSIR